jgi:hypothetical protein
MKIAILTFEGFNEIDSFVACGILNRMKKSGWKAEIACPGGERHLHEWRVDRGPASRSNSLPTPTRCWSAAA